MLFDLAAGLAGGAISALSSALLTPLEEIIKVFTAQNRCAHLMKVDGFSVLSKHNIERCESSVFQDFGHKWKLVFCPRGQENPEKISLYVEIEDAASLPFNWTVIVDLQFFILAQHAQTYLPVEWRGVSFNSSSTMRGIEWISLEELSRRGFLVNDSVIFGVEIMNLRQWNVPVRIAPPMGTAECLRLIEKPPNSKFTWKITKFSTFNQTTHFSNVFIVGQRKWSIQMYPKGVLEGQGNSLSVFLTALDYIDNAPRAKTLAKYKLRVLNQLNGAHYEYPVVHLFGPSGQGFGQRQFMPLKDLHDESKGFLVNDLIYIGVEFHVISVTDRF